MAAVVPLVVSAAAKAVGGGFTLGAFASSLASSLVVGGINSLLAQRKNSIDTSSYGSIRSTGVTQSVRQPITAREIVYGEVRKGGTIVHAAVTEGNKGANEVLSQFVVLASHEVQAIPEVIIGDESIPEHYIDNDGWVTEGRYAHKLRIFKHLGSPTQTANTVAVAEIPEWTTDHRLQGMAYLFVQMFYNRDKYPQGAPNVAAWLHGRKVLDPRDSTEKFSCNAALHVRDYMSHQSLGAGVDGEYIDDIVLNGTANLCDECVTTSNLDVNFTSVNTDHNFIVFEQDAKRFGYGDRVELISGTIGGLSTGTDYFVIPYQRMNLDGTVSFRLASSLDNALAGAYIALTSDGSGVIRKTGEPRYHGGGIIKTSAEPKSNTEELLSTMIGKSVYTGGVFRITGGEYISPTISLGMGDLAGSIKTRPKESKRERFNCVQGVYTSPIHNGNPSDYPAVKNSTYEAEDGRNIVKTVDFACIQRPGHSGRCGKILMERMRQEIVFDAYFKLSAFELQVGDNFYFNFDPYGWSSKIFEVMEWTLTNNNGAPVIYMLCRENAPEVYDWNSGEETQVDLAPNTSLPNAFEVDTPTDLVITVKEVNTLANDKTYSFNVSWTAPNNALVTQGGQYEVQYKRSVDTAYLPSYFVNGDLTSTTIHQIQPGVNYDIRVRAMNGIGRGVRSDWTQALGITVESPSGASLNIDYGFFTSPVADHLDFGAFAAEATNALDHGYFT